MKRRGRRRWTPEEKSEIINRYKKSSLSLYLFAEKVGIHSSVLYRWLRKNPTSATAETRSLVPVRVTTAAFGATKSSPLEVLLKNGRIVRVHRGFDEETLYRLVEVLERC